MRYNFINSNHNTILDTPLLKILNDTSLFNENFPFDEYHLTMAQSDVLEGIYNEPTVKIMFYRKAPFGSSYAITGGIIAFLEKLNSFSYKNLVPYLETKNYRQEFIDYVKSRDKIIAKIYSVPENSAIFPNEPIVILETNLIDSRILEGIILSEVNFATLLATKWHRIRNAALKNTIMEFGRRRSQNSIKSSLYAYISGIDYTSNCEANAIFGIPSNGTMGHEFIQSYDSEYEAFNKWLTHNPTKPSLLIDTINTLNSGLLNAEKVFLEHKENLIKHNSWDKLSIRIDSGDLAYLSAICYNYLSKALNTENITIILSNDLDEYSIESILSQLNKAGEDKVVNHISFGVGTKGVTCWGEPALGGVCKISEKSNKYILKISNNDIKTTIAGNIRSALITDEKGHYITTLIYLHDENIEDITKCYHPNDDRKFLKIDKLNYKITPRQHLMYISNNEKSEFVSDFVNYSLNQIREYQDDALASLDWSYKRITSPHRAKVSLSPKVFNIRNKMIKENIISMDK